MNINTHFTLRRGHPLFLFVSLFFAGLGLLLAWPSPAVAQGPVVEIAADIVPGSSGSNPARFAVYNGKLYFQANDGTHGNELWVYNGSTASMVADIYSGNSSSSPLYLTVYNGKLYFQASDSNYGSELWSYDGTDVALVQNIAIGINGSSPHDLAVYDGKLYFVADDRIYYGSELWVYDGSTASLVEDIYPGSDGSFPQFLTVYDDKLYFKAWDGTHGEELWSYDGSTASMVADIYPGSTGFLPQLLTLYDGKLYFSAIDSTHGQELWVYDGANASLVQDINPGSNSSPMSLAVYADKLYFDADDGTHGRELWVYDGSTAVRAQTITPYSNWTNSRPVAFYNDQTYFVADDGTHGYELWSYDGSTASMAADIYPGSNSSSPNFPAIYNNKLYFSANDGTHGNELWRLGYPSLEVSQTVDDATADPGQLLTYQVVVNNGTLITQTNMVISDTLPSELTLAGPVNLVGGSGTTAQDSGDLPTMVENLNLLPGQVVTVTFPVTVSINASGNLSLVNTVAVTSSEVSDWRTAVAVVTVNNFPPIITEGISTTVTMSRNGNPTPFDLTLHAGDQNVSDTLTWSIDTQASHGTAVAAGTGLTKTIDYTPTADYIGSDSFIVQVSDGSLADSVTVNVSVKEPACVPSATAGVWSVVFSHCALGEKHLIPDGYSVTLDVDINLAGNFEIESGGSFDPNGKTVTLTGSAAQTLTGNPLIFYRLTLQKDNPTDTVTIDGKLKVSRKLQIKSGKLVSASDYEDVEIESDGELQLTSDITISGHFTNSGTLDTNGYGLIFDGAKAQNLTLDNFTLFDNLTVMTGTTLIETIPDDNAFVNGNLTNYGSIRKSQIVDSGESFYYFGLAGTYNGADIELEIPGGDQGSLSAIQVERIDANHPNAPGEAVSELYWQITPTGSGYSATLTLPHNGITDPLACRYESSPWDCAADDADVDIVTRVGVTAFSDWVVYGNQVLAMDDAVVTDEETAVTISPLANDSILGGGSPTLTGVGIPRHGTAVISGTSKVIYTPTLNYAGSDIFTYAAGTGSLTGTGTITVTVQPINDAPQVIDVNGTYLSQWGSYGSGDGQFDTPYGVAVDAIGNVYVADLANSRIQKFDSNGTYLAKWGSYGSDDGQFDTPRGMAVDAAANVYVSDTYNSHIQTGSLGGPISTASVTMSEDSSPSPFNLTLNAYDVDGDPINWSIDTQASHGTAVAAGTGISQTISYTPTADYNGSDSFIVQVSDGSLTDTVTVSITVESVNDAPVAADDRVMVRRNDQGDLSILVATQPVTINVLSNDSDPDTPSDNSGLTITAVGSTSHGGNATINSGKRLIDYTPTAAFTGTETFSYTVSDGGLTATATVSVTVVNGAGGGSTDPGDSEGETIVIPKTGISQTITVTVRIPADVATDTLALVYNVVDNPSGAAPEGFTLAGLIFTLDAYLGQQLQPGYVFSTPITLIIEYSDADVAGLSGGENSLELRFWTGSAWRSDGITKLSQDTANNRIIFQLEHLSEFALFGPDKRETYLPLVTKNLTYGPDLVVDNVDATTSVVTVVIRNTGNASITDPFWVDVYANPTTSPGLNQPWATIAEAGAVWGVTQSLAPGESLTLTTGDAYYVAAFSSASIPTGATVYALVDSVNYNTNYGNVAESDESNNLGGPVTAGAGGSPPAINPAAVPNLKGLPKR
ncbi:MAG: tandem-95 repeat protein [Anaerolineales bacterium]|nr:tandem-95 repeat protein [Anaerolineales bacterium]